ncbi:Vab2p Ecym_4490 [Eremothecium cymbalariae DBVPG|uniref:BLOC-1 subunit VAB2 n=1 Tax=Eremothecium cymbalariae (strain CBS 270.75 / DBVPG 7215 / KCTC 17166 / NRRL Y-17582) TaxID=931890 RepID=G8JU26_ERECY|nr:hypothetical protein Ecym_4490 [Eremothecium cymbalariae DBVPG\
MSFLFSGDPRNLKRRIRHDFIPIKGSEVYKQLNSLAALPSCKELRQDNIFKIVSNEIRQVKSDIQGIQTRVNAEVDAEKEQADQLNQKLRTSAYKIDHTAKRVFRLRYKHENNTKKQIMELDTYIDSIDQSLKECQDIVNEVISDLSNVDLRLPEKERLLSNQQLNERHYPLLYNIFRGKFPSKFQSIQMLKSNDSSEIEIRPPVTEIYADSCGVEVSKRDYKGNLQTNQSTPLGLGIEMEDEFYSPKSPKFFAIQGSSCLGSLERSGCKKSTTGYSSNSPNLDSATRDVIPDKILMPRFQRVAAPQTATTLENVQITEPFVAVSAKNEDPTSK